MNKYEYRKAMNKIRWANRQKGEKWGKKEMGIAQKIVIHTLKAEGSGKNTLRDASHPMNLKDVLADTPLGKILKL